MPLVDGSWGWLLVKQKVEFCKVLLAKVQFV